MRRLRIDLSVCLLCLLVSLFACLSSMARVSADAADETDAKAEVEGAPSEQELPWKLGPAALSLGHGVELALPASYQFLGQPEAGQIMAKMGNLYNDNLLGLVVPSGDGDQSDQGDQGDQDDYFITMRYDEEGYIKDDEALDGDDILKAMRDGEDEYNEERKKAGFPAIHADGWQEAPHYDKVKHQVIWGLTLTTPDDASDSGDKHAHSVNYNTRVLGRKGYVSVNLVTDTVSLAKHKPAASSILAGTTFSAGQRYENFDEKNDKVAEYGLTGLVLGGMGLGVAKLVKIGLLAKFGKVIFAALLASKKVIVGLLIAAAAAVKRLFGRRASDQSQA